MVELEAVSLKCTRTDISPRYDKLTNGRTGAILLKCTSEREEEED